MRPKTTEFGLAKITVFPIFDAAFHGVPELADCETTHIIDKEQHHVRSFGSLVICNHAFGRTKNHDREEERQTNTKG
jgi:hypothetical protein